jgi:hypothetical protein
VVFTLIVLHRLDNWLPSRTAKTLTVKLPAGDGDNVARVRKALKTRRLRLGSFDYSRDFQSNIETITFRMSIPPGVDEDLLHTIAEEIPELTHLAVR